MAIALIDIAVNIVCRETDSKFRDLLLSYYFCISRQSNTHTATAYEDDAEALQHPGISHHPGQPQEQDDTEDVLEAGQVNAHERPHLWRLEGERSRERQQKSNVLKTQSRLLCFLDT